jgi:hypothetical protein
MSETPTIVELERLRGAVGAQRQRVAELEHAAQSAARELGAAREALADFYRWRERGRDAEPGTEQELIERVRELEGGLTLQPVVKPGQSASQVQGEDLQPAASEVEFTVVDPRTKAMLEGARELLDEREAELRAFVVDNLAELAVERAPQAARVAANAERELHVAQSVIAEYEAERAWWAAVLRVTIPEGQPLPEVDVPANPFEGLVQGVKVKPPMPERFLQK